MKSKIESYISFISLDNDGNWRFSGDGSGDFEEHANRATREVVLDYISTCSDQIKLAKEWLNENPN